MADGHRFVPRRLDLHEGARFLEPRREDPPRPAEHGASAGDTDVVRDQRRRERVPRETRQRHAVEGEAQRPAAVDRAPARHAAHASCPGPGSPVR